MSIRSKIANYMRAHQDDFIFFIDTASGEPLTKEQYEQYCARVEQSSDWGGHIELQAFAACFKRPTRVYQAYGAPILSIGEEFTAGSSDKGLLRLSYHKHYYALGEHYNSIVPSKPRAQKADV